MAEEQSKNFTRRKFLRVAGLSAASVAVLAACGETATPAVTTSSATTAAATSAAAMTTSVAAATTSAAAMTSAAGAVTAGGAMTTAPAVINGAGKTLTVAFIGDQAGADKRSAVLPGFLQKIPGLQVKFLPVAAKDWNEFFSKILSMKASGTTPDIVSVATEGSQNFAAKGLSTALDDYVKRDKAALMDYFSDVNPGLVESMMYNGHLYHMPDTFNAVMMYVNMNVANAAGVTIPDNWDKDQFYDVAKKLVKKDGNQTSVYGYSWPIRLWGSSVVWMQANGSNILTQDKFPGGDWLWSTFYKADDPMIKGRAGGIRWGAPKANDPANVEALNFLIQMSKEGTSPIIDPGNGGAMQGSFASGKIGMTPSGGFYVGGLKAAGMGPNAFDIRQFPKWKNQTPQFGAEGYVIMQDAKDKDLAWEFLKYIVSKDAILSNKNVQANTTTAARRSILTEAKYAPTGPKSWKLFYDALDKNPDALPIPAPPQEPQVNDIMNKYISLAMSGDQDAKTALDNSQKDLEALFKQS